MLFITDLQGDVVELLGLYLTPTIPSSTDETDAQQFIVFRNTQASNDTNNVQLVCNYKEKTLRINY